MEIAIRNIKWLWDSTKHKGFMTLTLENGPVYEIKKTACKDLMKNLELKNKGGKFKDYVSVDALSVKTETDFIAKEEKGIHNSKEGKLSI